MAEINEERKYCVYMHTNKINNKVYVGQTCKSVNDRWRKNGAGYLHKRHDGTYFQPLFARAINKYGWDNFEHIIFAECLTKSEAYHTERLLIALYQSNNPKCGYNLSSGGESGMAGRTMSDEQRKKLSEIRKKCWENIDYKQKQIESHKWQTGENHPFYGRHHSEETKEKLRQLHIGQCLSQDAKNKLKESNKGEKNPFYGKTHTEESKNKISNANSGSKNGRARKLIQCDKHGNFIKIWECIRDASINLNINYTSIVASCNGRQKSAGGFIWKYFIEEDFNYV